MKQDGIMLLGDTMDSFHGRDDENPIICPQSSQTYAW